MDESIITIEIEDIKCDVKDHEDRLRKVEVVIPAVLTRMDNLTKSIDGLVGWLKAIAITVITGFISFILWYLQHLIK